MLVCLVEAISALPLACVVPLPISRLATCLHASLDGLLSMTCHLLVEHCRSTLHPRWIVCDREGFTCFFGYFSLVLSLPRIHRGSRIASVVLVHRPASVAIPSIRHLHPVPRGTLTSVPRGTPTASFQPRRRGPRDLGGGEEGLGIVAGGRDRSRDPKAPLGRGAMCRRGSRGPNSPWRTVRGGTNGPKSNTPSMG